MTVSGFLIPASTSSLVMFAHLSNLGGFTLIQMLLYGASSVGLRVADLLIGSVEQIATSAPAARPDAHEPVPLLVQVCATTSRCAASARSAGR